MDTKMSRIASFISWPQHVSVNTIRMAQAGFHFTGMGDFVRCYTCGVELDNWERRGDPLTEHKNNSPSCYFIKDQTKFEDRDLSTNQEGHGHQTGLAQAMSELTGNVLQINQQNNCHTETNLGSSTDSRLVPLQHTVTTSVKSDSQQHHPSPQLPVHHFPTHQPHTPLEPDLRHTRNVSFMHRMKSEQERRATYFDFPSSVPQNPNELAAAGFFYMGMTDRTRCAFCCGVLNHWEACDIPMEEHRRHFSQCPLVNGRDVGNLPISVSTEQNCLSQSFMTQISEVQEKSGTPTTQADREEKKSHKDSSMTVQVRNEDVEVSTLLREHDAMRERRLCKVCMDEDADIVFLPCSHLCSCNTCAPRLSTCPVCRQYIKATVKIFVP